MKNKIFLLVLFLGVLQSCTQSPVQSQKYKGFPSREGEIDIKANFANPPKGYGNVPFYWWSGDTLIKERLAEQLDILGESATDGFAVSYIHTHPKVEVELNANGYGGFGRVEPGSPGVFTDEWWDTWNWFSAACAERGMGAGLDDYVVGWPGNGFYVDELKHDAEFANYQGRLKVEKYTVQSGKVLQTDVPERWVSVTAFPASADLKSHIKDGKLSWKNTSSQSQTVYVIHTEASCELHPEYGERLVDVYFKRFEEKLDAKGREGMNYFFQDELFYDLNLTSWCEDMPSEFQKRKGYDVLPYLPAVFEHIGDITPKIRIDYADVVMQLSEERYFEPIFEWHNQRGLIYGCDNHGRGLDPLQYMDYFRATSWYTAPGNDAPARGSRFRHTKVSSSIAHLYERPRTWLEAFHSMGWNSNGEWLTTQLDHHVMAGGNLLCMHGLYYSTRGGWWEWAPPCFHFRMPYWPHMKEWLKYAERLCFLFSQGLHVCDVAVMYPTESMQAYPETELKLLWQTAEMLSTSGLDYDFINTQSLLKAQIEDEQLHVAGEKYKVLVLADIKAIPHETLLKIQKFHQKGGIVLAVGSLPVATTHKGENDAETQTILNNLFSTNAKGVHAKDYQNLPSIISNLITPDFKTSDGKGRVLHRKVGQRDVYMIMDVANGAELFFRAKGQVECWDAKDGSIVSQPVLRQTEEGTWIKYTGASNVSRILVFSPGEPDYKQTVQESLQVSGVMPVEGKWSIDIRPTMDNKWGDFRQPASHEMIGVEAREFAYAFIENVESMAEPPAFKDDAMNGVYGYAPYLKTLTLDASVNLDAYFKQNVNVDTWQSYCYSWQYGVLDSPGSQGYHGLKGKVDNGFIILDQGGHQLYATQIYVPETGEYRLEQEGIVPDYLFVDGNKVKEYRLSMEKGWHEVLWAYANTKKEAYSLYDKRSECVDFRERSSLVFYRADAPVAKDNRSYSSVVAMKWYHSEHLAYSAVGGKEGVWAYRFETAPGTKSLTFKLQGTLKQLWIDGKEVDAQHLTFDKQKECYVLHMPRHTSDINTIVLTAMPQIGYDGPAIFTEPVRITTEGGEIPAGNWTQFGAMKFYSGSVVYQKKVDVSALGSCRQLELDLGSIDATCEVKINGKEKHVFIGPPYKLDITPYVDSNQVQIEVLVYSTLSNHYQTTPTAYRGEPRSGLLGPVKIVGYK